MSKIAPSTTSHLAGTLNEFANAINTVDEKMTDYEARVLQTFTNIQKEIDDSQKTELGSVTSVLGIKINWIKYGKIYSFWFDETNVLSSNLIIPNGQSSFLNLFTSDDIPPLKLYQGSPFHLLIFVDQNGIIAQLNMQISENGIGVRTISTGQTNIVAGRCFTGQFVIILDEAVE